MSDAQRPGALRRKAGEGRPPPETGQATAGKLLRLCLAKAAEDVAGLTVMATAVEEARVARDASVETLPEHALLALVEGPDSRFGLVVLDAQALAALIEVQTTGRVVPRPAEARAPTRTDAIMCADFIDALLEVFEQRVAEAALVTAPALAGYRYAMPLADPRAVAMTLDDLPYRQFTAALDLGQGAKQGEMRLLLPFDPPGAGPRPGGQAEAFTATLAAHVMAAPARLSATLARVSLPLAEVTRFAPGHVIAIPREALGAVALEDVTGRVISHGRLGQIGGHRAVRLAAPGDDTGAGGDAAGFVRAAQPAAQVPATPGPGGGPGGGPAALPDLPELPDIAGLPDLGGLPDGAASPDATDFPDLAAFGVME